MTDTEFKLITTRFDTVENLLGGINQRLDKLNGKVYEHESVIQEAIGERKQNRQAQEKSFEKVQELDTRMGLVEKAELVHIINCPVNPKLRAIEDQLLSQKSVKKFMGVMFTSGIALGALIVAILKLILG